MSNSIQNECKLPLVTIMIPTYNQEAYIAEAIESALAQDYPNLEVIVSDDGSSDNTGEICKSYSSDARFMYFKNDKNLGRVGNYHHILYELSKGEWVINLDGDDYYTDSGFVSRAISRILNHDGIVCYFGIRTTNHLEKRYRGLKVDNGVWKFEGINYFLDYFHIDSFLHAQTMYKREIALQDKKCYTYDSIFADVHGVLRLSVYGNVLVAQENSYTWRKHGDNATYSINGVELWNSQRDLIHAMARDLPDNITSKSKLDIWVAQGEQSCLNNYCIERMIHAPSLKSILRALHHCKWSVSFLILTAKVSLKSLGIHIKI